MTREILTLEAARFTNPRALAREVSALLESSDYKLVVVGGIEALMEVKIELEDRILWSRIKLIEQDGLIDEQHNPKRKEEIISQITKDEI